MKNESRPTLASWYLISPILPRRWRSAIVLRELISMSQRPRGALNAKNMDTVGKHVEDDTCLKCSENDLDHLEEDCLKEIRCTNCQQDHPTYTRSCDVYKKEKEILEVKYKWNVSFLEARKIVGTHIGENSYASVAWRADTTNQDNKYRTLVEKLFQ